VPDPNGPPFNSDRVDLKPNEGQMETNIEMYRTAEYQLIERVSKSGFTFISIYSTRKYNIIEAILNIARTLFVSVVLSISVTYFIRDANVILLYPIERMLKKVKFIAKNPMAAANEDLDH
jgi:hypothetical protein